MTLTKFDYLLAGFATAAAMYAAEPAHACDCPPNLSLPGLPKRAQPAIPAPVVPTPVPVKTAQPVEMPAMRDPTLLVQTIQHRPVDVAALDFEGLQTLIDGKGFFRPGTALDACVEGDADPSQPNSYNAGLSAARAKATAEAAAKIGLNVVRQFPFGENRATAADNRLESQARRTITYIGPRGVFGDIAAAPNCFLGAWKKDNDLILRRGAPFVSPRHETARDGEYRPPVRNTYVPKGLN